jgi:CHASE3 domain sensor protein
MLDSSDRQALHGYANTIRMAMDQLGQSVQAQGVGLSEKLDNASQRVADALDRASAASERHAKNLAWATWALVIATVVLVVVTILPRLT